MANFGEGGRDEFNPAEALEYKPVLKLFKRLTTILKVHVNGRIIEVSDEHPFYVISKGWTPANTLERNDQLLSHTGELLTIDQIDSAVGHHAVYNCQVADYHTYFVGCQEWGFSVWAHNSTLCVVERRLTDASEAQCLGMKTGDTVYDVVDAGGRVQRTYPDKLQADVMARELGIPARSQSIPDPHNSKPSMQRELLDREQYLSRRAEQRMDVGREGETVRRFMSYEEYKEAMKKGIKYDATMGQGAGRQTSGIPTTSTNIEPMRPDRIKEVTGAPSADYYIDFDISGKPVLRTTTGQGRVEIRVQGNLRLEDIVNNGRVRP